MQVCRLTPVHAAEYRALMLQAYALEPDAFTSTPWERERLPLEWWNSRVSDRPDSPEMTFGAFIDGRLVGAAGLRRETRERIRHKAFLYGMFVLPAYRGQGVARPLVKAVLDQARSLPDMRVVKLTVTATNRRAIRLYESCGFVPFGTEPLAIRHGERFASLLHMWCDLTAPAGGEATSSSRRERRRVR